LFVVVDKDQFTFCHLLISLDVSGVN